LATIVVGRSNRLEYLAKTNLVLLHNRGEESQKSKWGINQGRQTVVSVAMFTFSFPAKDSWKPKSLETSDKSQYDFGSSPRKTKTIVSIICQEDDGCLKCSFHWIALTNTMLMEEILYHLGCIKHCK